MRRIILTKDVLDSIPALVEQGMNKAEIAARLGCTTNTLQVQCSRRKISLRKGGPRVPRQLKVPPEAKLTLSQHALVMLQKNAHACGYSEAKLASELLKVIATDDLYTAVLDSEPA
jgi:hypothetical protein